MESFNEPSSNTKTREFLEHHILRFVTVKSGKFQRFGRTCRVLSQNIRTIVSYFSLTSCFSGNVPTIVSEKLLVIFLTLDQCFLPPGRGPVLGPGINYNGPREVLLEFVILVF